MLKKFIKNRKGTAEVVGSVMFIIILVFFFTNVYLWHDAGIREVNDLQVKKMGALMGVVFDDNSHATATLTAEGSGVVLTRLWIVTSDDQHYRADLAPAIKLVAGSKTTITLQTQPGGLTRAEVDANGITLYYPSTSNIKQLSALNTLGILVST